MILAASRPYFAPYPGYFRKAALADVQVILDSVQFPQGTTWINRNRFKCGQGMLWLTIPVRTTGLGRQSIHEVRICREGRWLHKHLESLRHAYTNAPYAGEHLPFLSAALARPREELVELNLEIITYLMKQLGITTPVVRLSDLSIRESGTRLIVAICRQLGAATYLTQSSARRYLDTAQFEAAGIALQFFTPPSPVYPQLWGDFIADLSTFDLLFTCGPMAGQIASVR